MMHRASRWLATILLCLPGAASANHEGKLNLFEQEAKQIAQTLPTPDNLSNTQPQRRLVDAQTSFTLGDYDQAALALFELASRPGPEQDVANYYLAESLFQKGDKGAARTYYQFVANNTASAYRQRALVRLIEVAIAQQDTADVDMHVAALDGISPPLPQVPYVKGKLAFSQGKHDEALTLFTSVPKGSPFELQATYYVGTTAVAKKDLARATEVFTDLVNRKPKSSADRRVIELAQLALGRVYYERDQPSKAIDSYLLVDRNSDLFPDALYEVAWVYVKGKQFDKALRALELLALSEPDSNKTPTVRLLEGNLRIRKAQMIRASQISGTIDANAKADPAIEYDKAAVVFADTHATYFPSYQALTAMLEGSGDPADYLAQLAERQTSAFQAAAPIPDAAAQYLRDEPEVQRAVANQVDLATIQAHLTEAEHTIARLEGVIAANDRTVVYPGLTSRRARIGEIQSELIALRNDLAEQQLTLIAPSGELAQASSNRKALAAQYATLPDPEKAHAQVVDEARVGYDAIDASTGEISSALDSTQAVAVALRKYVNEPPVEGMATIAPDQKTSVNSELVSTAGEVAAIEHELKEIRRELELGRDLSGAGDEAYARAREARRALRAAQDTEHRLFAGFASSSRDQGRSANLIRLGDRAAKISADLDATEAKIDSIVDGAMAQAKDTISKERVNVDAYKAELAEYEIESRAIGGTVLGASFKNVKAKFYDVIVRSDVGSVDVVYSQKEEADDELKRLNLSRQRELKQLKDEFKDILDATLPGTSAPPAPAEVPPEPSGQAPSGSPDKGEGGERVKPGTDVPKASTPTVRPDNEAPAPAPKKGGSK